MLFSIDRESFVLGSFSSHSPKHQGYTEHCVLSVGNNAVEYQYVFDITKILPMVAKTRYVDLVAEKTGNKMPFWRTCSLKGKHKCYLFPNVSKAELIALFYVQINLCISLYFPPDREGFSVS